MTEIKVQVETTEDTDNEEETKGKTKSEQTIIKETDFVQNSTFPAGNTNSTRIKIAR
ncbi:MAG: hypothetical protein WDO71_19385 [Bacteroidota bacterium]